MSMVTIATWALAGSYDTDASLKRHLTAMEEAATAGADLVVSVAEIDGRGGIEAATARSRGPRLWRDRRPETYTHLAAPADV
jgi:hypothetical protein